MRACRSIPGMLSIIRPRRIPSGSRPILMASATEIWDWATFLRSGFGSAPNPNSNWIQFAPTVDGQLQVSTARNVAMTPPQCPTTEAGTGKPYFQKEFFHNGYIKSLKQLVHFYNTRDVVCRIQSLPDTARRERRKR